MPLKTYEKINTVVFSLQFGRHWNWCNSQTLIFLFDVAAGISARCLTEERNRHGPPVRQAQGYVPSTAGRAGSLLKRSPEAGTWLFWIKHCILHPNRKHAAFHLKSHPKPLQKQGHLLGISMRGLAHLILRTTLFVRWSELQVHIKYRKRRHLSALPGSVYCLDGRQTTSEDRFQTNSVSQGINLQSATGPWNQIQCTVHYSKH